MVKHFNRRHFIFKTIPLSFILAVACNSRQNKEDKNKADVPMTDCEDLSHVPVEEVSKREKLGYSMTSPMADKTCTNCNLYIPSSESKPCGGCMLFKGPVLAEAYCTYWAPQV